MKLDTLILLIFFIKIILYILTNFINKKISFFVLINIISTILFLIVTSFREMNILIYIFSEVSGLGISIIICLIKYERTINRQVLPIINPVVSNSVALNKCYVINPDNSLALGTLSC